MRRGVSHAKRPDGFGPAHVSLKIRRGLPSMRTPRAYRLLERAFRLGQRSDFTICAYSVLGNHLHLVIEADGARSLTRGMQGLAIRIAKALNRHWHRRGTVFPDRYYARFLRKVGEIRRVFRYVLQNARKHGVCLPTGLPDPFSSARWFEWERKRPFPAPLRSPPVHRPRFIETLTALRANFSLFDLPGAPSHPASALI